MKYVNKPTTQNLIITYLIMLSLGQRPVSDNVKKKKK